MVAIVMVMGISLLDSASKVMVLAFLEGWDYSGFWSSRAAWPRIGSTEQGKGKPSP